MSSSGSAATSGTTPRPSRAIRVALPGRPGVEDQRSHSDHPAASCRPNPLVTRGVVLSAVRAARCSSNGELEDRSLDRREEVEACRRGRDRRRGQDSGQHHRREIWCGKGGVAGRCSRAMERHESLSAWRVLLLDRIRGSSLRLLRGPRRGRGRGRSNQPCVAATGLWAPSWRLQ